MTEPLSLSAVMSVARLDFSDAVECAWVCAAKLGINFRRHQGAFWHSTITNAIETAIAEDNPKYILTVDNDSLYTPDDVRELYRLMETHPEAAAIFPVQSGRDRQKIQYVPTPDMLLDAEGDKPQIAAASFEQELMPAASGHFGLTIIRTEVLEAMPHPWFLSMTDGRGHWGEDRVDADAYFWLWLLHKNYLFFLAPRVVIGHMQLVATWPDEMLESSHQYINDWRRTGKPGNVWK